MLESHSHLFNGSVDLKNAKDARLLVAYLLGLMYQERILSGNDALLKLLTGLAEIDNQRDRKHVWVPRGLNKLLNWTLSKEETTSAAQNETQNPKRVATAESDKDGYRQTGVHALALRGYCELSLGKDPLWSGRHRGDGQDCTASRREALATYEKA